MLQNRKFINIPCSYFTCIDSFSRQQLNTGKFALCFSHLRSIMPNLCKLQNGIRRLLLCLTVIQRRQNTFFQNKEALTTRMSLRGILSTESRLPSPRNSNISVVARLDAFMVANLYLEETNAMSSLFQFIFKILDGLTKL